MGMDFDTLLFSRLQLGFTAGFHVLFATLAVGLASFLVVFEARWLASGRRRRVFLLLYDFWARIFVLFFGAAMASGVVFVFGLGTGFGPFAAATGDVLGPFLGYAVLSLFFLQAGLLGIVLHGRKRLRPRLHFAATVTAALATLAFAFWALAAVSWLHTPAGHALADGRFYVIDRLAALFTPSFPSRFVHAVLAGYIGAGLLVAAVSAGYLRRKRHENFARNGYAVALWFVIVAAPLQMIAGAADFFAVAAYQPIKAAAVAGLWESGPRAPLVLFAIPDRDEERNRWVLEIPAGASLAFRGDSSAVVAGLKSTPPADRPNTPIVFFAFRFMVLVGFALLLLAGWMGAAWRRQRVYDDRRLMVAAIAAAPLAPAATLAGWIVAEAGQWPWAVQGLLRVADAASAPAPAAVLAVSAAVFAVFCLLFSVVLLRAVGMLKAGPNSDISAGAPIYGSGLMLAEAADVSGDVR